MKKFLVVTSLVLTMLVMVACTAGSSTEVVAAPPGPSGPQGPAGVEGPAGPAGPVGAKGEAGLDYMPPTYVGSLACEGCHEDLYTSFLTTGHSNILKKVIDGQPPQYPYSEVPNPPEGHTWDDILYVTGGYGWAARFIDQEGFMVTGVESDTTQYNLPNSILDMGDDWVAYHAGEEKPFDCGTCHTTGYIPEGNQDGLPGLIGTWAEDGVGCEACHGPGGNHVNDPYQVSVAINRDSELCGQCHSDGVKSQIDASDGFIHGQEQYDELFQSKKRLMNCVDCHNPHLPIKYERAVGIKSACENCHFEKEVNQKITDRRHAKCVDCHMPRVGKSALADPAQFSGDVRTHLMGINPLALEQFTKDGSQSLPYLSVTFACRGCHYDAGRGPNLTDDVLQETALGFHDRDLAGSVKKQ